MEIRRLSIEDRKRRRDQLPFYLSNRLNRIFKASDFNKFWISVTGDFYFLEFICHFFL